MVLVFSIECESQKTILYIMSWNENFFLGPTQHNTTQVLPLKRPNATTIRCWFVSALTNAIKYWTFYAIIYCIRWWLCCALCSLCSVRTTFIDYFLRALIPLNQITFIFTKLTDFQSNSIFLANNFWSWSLMKS